MALDKTIHKHIDEMDAIEDAVVLEIDELMKQIEHNFNRMIESPQEVLDEVIDAVFEEIIYPRREALVKAGNNVALKFKEDDIEIPDSNDPELNDDQRDD